MLATCHSSVYCPSHNLEYWLQKSSPISPKCLPYTTTLYVGQNPHPITVSFIFIYPPNMMRDTSFFSGIKSKIAFFTLCSSSYKLHTLNVINRCFPSPPLWRTLRTHCLRWRHRPALVEQWTRASLCLTARLLKHMYGPLFPLMPISKFFSYYQA